MIPKGTAWPKAWVAWSTSPVVQPGPTRTVRFFGSTRTPFIVDRSMTSPSSTAAKAGPVVTAAADCDGKLVVAAEVHRGDHVGDVGTARDHERPLVDHAVIELAAFIVLGMIATD